MLRKYEFEIIEHFYLPIEEAQKVSAYLGAVDRTVLQEAPDAETIAQDTVYTYAPNTPLSLIHI